MGKKPRTTFGPGSARLRRHKLGIRSPISLAYRWLAKSRANVTDLRTRQKFKSGHYRRVACPPVTRADAILVAPLVGSGTNVDEEERMWRHRTLVVGLLCSVSSLSCDSPFLLLPTLDEDSGTSVDTGSTPNANPGDAGNVEDAGPSIDTGATTVPSHDARGACDGDSTSQDAGGRGQVLYTSCTVLGDLDCSLADPQVRLLCDGMTWNPIGVCVGSQTCDTQPGTDHGLCTGADAGVATDAGANSPSNDVVDAGVVLYTPCPALGALECSLADPKIQVLCDGMTWNPIGVCVGSQTCDTQPGTDHGLCTGADAGVATDGGANSPADDAAVTGVVLYTPCLALGTLDCSLADPKIQVLCDGMTWNPIGTCAGQLVCDPLPGPGQGLCKAP